mgnify:CR=1 FL=1
MASRPVEVVGSGARVAREAALGVDQVREVDVVGSRKSKVGMEHSSLFFGHGCSVLSVCRDGGWCQTISDGHPATTAAQQHSRQRGEQELVVIVAAQQGGTAEDILTSAVSGIR